MSEGKIKRDKIKLIKVGISKTESGEFVQSDFFNYETESGLLISDRAIEEGILFLTEEDLIKSLY